VLVEHEYLAKALETIESELTGDCDDFATLIATFILSIGGEIRVTIASGPDGGHAYTEGRRFNRFQILNEDGHI
jgi:hypothetical protein